MAFIQHTQKYGPILKGQCISFEFHEWLLISYHNAALYGKS